MFNHFKIGKHRKSDGVTKEIPEHIKIWCHTYQRFTHPLIGFKVVLPIEKVVVFREGLSMALLFLNGEAVLHVVDTATHYSGAIFLDAHRANHGHCVLLAFFMIWCNISTGYPNRLLTDQGSMFTSERCKNWTDLEGTELRLFGVAPDSSFDIEERYYEPLQRV